MGNKKTESEQLRDIEQARLEKELGVSDEQKRAAACVAFIRKTADEFKVKEFPKCGGCGHQREEIEVWQPEDKREISEHPILGYGWADDGRAILNPFRDESYRWTARALEAIADALDGCEDFTTLIQHLDDWETGEFADGLTSPHTASLLAWLSSNINNVSYMDDAISELGAKDGNAILTGAQYLAIQQHAENVRAAVHEYLQNEENKEGSE